MNDTNSFLNQLFMTGGSDLFSLGDVLLAMVVTTILCYMLAFVYRATHRGTSYSQSFLLTLFLMGVCTSVVMLIIGSNIARAFSLVGALSIIRFRTAMKDPRDTGFLFAAMIAGMGCGSQFYMPAIAMTIFISVLVMILYAQDYGLKNNLETIVKVTFKESEEAARSIIATLENNFKNVKMINRVLDFGEGNVTNVYIVRPGKNTDTAQVENSLRAIDAVKRLSIYETDQHSAP